MQAARSKSDQCQVSILNPPEQGPKAGADRRLVTGIFHMALAAVSHSFVSLVAKIRQWEALLGIGIQPEFL